MGRKIERPDETFIHLYAPGDGHLSYTRADDKGRALPYDVTDDEAEQLCPAGWSVYRDGPYHRCKPSTTGATQ